MIIKMEVSQPSYLQLASVWNAACGMIRETTNWKFLTSSDHSLRIECMECKKSNPIL